MIRFRKLSVIQDSLISDKNQWKSTCPINQNLVLFLQNIFFCDFPSF